MKYIDSIVSGEYNFILHSDSDKCLDVFLRKDCCLSKTKSNKNINVYSVIRNGIVNNVMDENKKVRNGNYNVYISNREGGPKGLLIEKLNRGDICSYIIVADDANSQLVLLRSVFIKMHFLSSTKGGAFPIHCSSICHKGNAYLFLAESNGGKSTVYFSFASNSDPKAYSLMSDDTILCRMEENEVIGTVLPLKPSLRRGTMDYVPQTKCFADQFKMGYNMDDQIYVDVEKLENSRTVLQSKIKAAFFINFSDKFNIEKINDLELLKKKIAIIICGYKATPVNESFLVFINKIIENVRFYNIYIPKNMKDFHEKFDVWLKNNEEVII